MAQNAKLPQRATVVDQPGCRANSPDGWSCTAVATHVAAGLDHVAYGAEGEICATWPVTAPLDSERWDCRSCGAPHIGKRPADDTCRGCVVTQVTTEPARPDWLPSEAELAEARRINRAAAAFEHAPPFTMNVGRSEVCFCGTCAALVLFIAWDGHAAWHARIEGGESR